MILMVFRALFGREVKNKPWIATLYPEGVPIYTKQNSKLTYI